MKWTKVLLFALLLAVASECVAQRTPDDRRFGLIDGLAEVLLLRPGGLVLTVVGTAFFVATSPMTALAAIAPPHDAFSRAAGVFVVAPAKYTFYRPMGVYHMDASGQYRYPEE